MCFTCGQMVLFQQYIKNVQNSVIKLLLTFLMKYLHFHVRSIQCLIDLELLV